MCHQIRHKTHAACKPAASKQTDLLYLVYLDIIHRPSFF
jgi:hypothetical protein